MSTSQNPSANQQKAYRIDLGRFSAPEMTEHGYLRADAFVTRTGIFEYQLLDGSIRRELRPAEEVFDWNSLHTLSEIPITNDHPPSMLDANNTRNYVIGWTSKDVRKNKHFVECGLTIIAQDAINEIISGKKQETSCGYVCDIEETPGVWQGERYDAIQRNIRYNHVAVVEYGRAGRDVKIHMDSQTSGLQFGVMKYDSASITDAIEETENEIRARIKSPELFIPETFRTKELPNGISIIIGKLKNPPEGQEGSMVVQSYRFKKPEWTFEKAKQWLEKHNLMVTSQLAAEVIDNINEKEVRKMSKIMVQGKEYEVDDELAKIVTNYEKEKEDLLKNIEELKAKSDALTAEFDKVSNELKTMQAEKIAEQQKKDRAALLELAKPLISADIAKKLDDEQSDLLTIKKAVLAIQSPELKLDDKSEDYINARFDFVIEQINKKDDVTSALIKNAQDKSYGDDIELIRRKAMERAQNAWKKGLETQN